MNRDILNGLINAVAQVQPAGTSAITPASSNTGSGTIAFDASSLTQGTFNGVIEVTTSGPPGTAQAQISLDGGSNFGPVFTIPSGPYAVPLPAISPNFLSPALSGLVLDFSGSFNDGDSYSFVAIPSITWLYGAEELSGQDSLFPRVLLVPMDDSFEGSENFSAPIGGTAFNQFNSQRSLVTDVARFETHCWGCDYDRTEVLRDTVINGIHFAFQAVKRITRGGWQATQQVAQAGRLYVFEWSVKKPVLQLEIDTTTAEATSAVVTQEFDDTTPPQQYTE
jgi:hypothetical protein